MEIHTPQGKTSLIDFSLFDYKEFYILNSYIIFKIIIGKIENEIIINCKNYKISFNVKDLYILTGKNFDSIEDAYDYIVNIFEQNNYRITKISTNKEIHLLLKLNNNKELELILLYNKNNTDIIINELNKLKTENKKLKKDINILKGYHDNGSNPKDIKLLSNITNESFTEVDLDNTFTVFKSVNDLLYLIYSTKNKSIICHDLVNQRIVKELTKCHDEYITSLTHYLDKIDNKDLVLSLSSNDNNLKLWNVNNWSLLLNINKVNNKGFLYSACFINENENNYIATCNAIKKGEPENIKIFDFNGNKIKEIIKSNKNTLFIDSYYDDILRKNYIVTGNADHVKSYDFKKNEVYHKYHEKNNNKCHCSLIIKANEEIIKLLESSADGYIRIWNFHSAILINKIKIDNILLYGLCLWNNNYLFVGTEDKMIKLIDLNNGIIINSFSGHKNAVLTIKKLIHPQYGEWLISQGLKDDNIKIWSNKN